MAIPVQSIINVSITTVNAAGDDITSENFCNAEDINGLQQDYFNFDQVNNISSPYTWPEATWTAVDGPNKPVGATCTISSGGSVQPRSGLECGGASGNDCGDYPFGCNYTSIFPIPCPNYYIVDHPDGLEYNAQGRYTHNVEVLYTPPVVYGCTDSDACNHNPNANTECTQGNASCCNYPQLQVDFEGNLCGTGGGCTGDDDSGNGLGDLSASISSADGFGEYSCTDFDGADNSCCPDHNNSGLCDPNTTPLSSFDSCSNHNGYDGIDYWIPTEDTGDVVGCTDSTACNYNPDATWYDASCVGNSSEGCGCLNNEQAPSPDSCCDGITYCQVGSTNPNGHAIYSDASYTTCAEQVTCGCTDGSACNYNAAASYDDGTCISQQEYCGCTDNTAADAPSECWGEDGCTDCFGDPEIYYCVGSTTETNGTCDTTCYYADHNNGDLPGDCTGSWTDSGSGSCGGSAGGTTCTSSQILQTMDVECPLTQGPGTCEDTESQGPFYQCIESVLCNTGCTDPYADNYDPSAYIDNSLCDYTNLNSLSYDIIVTEFFPQVNPGAAFGPSKLQIPDYVEITNVSNSTIDLSNYYIDTHINGVRTFAALSGVSEYVENNNNGFLHNATLDRVSDSMLQTQYCDDPEQHFYYGNDCNGVCTGECSTITHGGKFVIFSNNEINNYGTIKSYGNPGTIINLGDIIGNFSNSDIIAWETALSTNLEPLNVSFTNLNLTNQSGEYGCITLWDDKPPHRDDAGVVCNSENGCPGQIKTQICYGADQGNDNYPSIMSMSGQLGMAVQYNTFFGSDISQYRDNSNWDIQEDWDDTGDLTTGTDHLFSTPQAFNIFNFWNYILTSTTTFDVTSLDWAGLNNNNLGSPFSANANYNPETIQTCTEQNAINFICNIPCEDNFWTDNGISHLCGTDYGDICWNNGVAIPSYISNDPSECQFEIINDCANSGAYNYFCDTCYDDNSASYCNDYCSSDGGDPKNNCYQYYCDDGVTVCLTPDENLEDFNSCNNYIPCTLTGSQSCVSENGSCQFPVILTFGDVTESDPDCGGCQTIEVLAHNSLPIHNFSSITFENLSDEALNITHVILSDELINKSWSSSIASGQVSISNDDEPENTIDVSYTGDYDFTGDAKLLYKIGFTTDSSKRTQTLRMQIDTNTTLHDVANNNFINITASPELVATDNVIFDCDGILYHSGDSYTIQDNCGTCVEFVDADGDSIVDLGCWYSQTNTACNPTDDTADNYCPTATCDGVPSGNSTTDCSENGVVECCCPDDGSVCHTGTPLCAEYDECGVCNGGGMAAQCTAAGLTFGDLEGNCCDSDDDDTTCTTGIRDCAGNCTCDANGENCAVNYDLCGVCDGNNASMVCDCCPPDAPSNAGKCTSDNGITWTNYADSGPAGNGGPGQGDDGTWEWGDGGDGLKDCTLTCFGTSFTDVNCGTCTQTPITQDCALNCELLSDGTDNPAYLANLNDLDGEGRDACGTCPNLYPGTAGVGNYCVIGAVPSVDELGGESSEWSHCYHWNGSPGCFDCAGIILSDTNADGYGDTAGDVANSYDVCGDCAGPNAGIAGAADLGCGCDESEPNYTLYDDSDDDSLGCGNGEDGTTKLFCENVNTTNYVVGSGDGYSTLGIPCIYTLIYDIDDLTGCFIPNTAGNPKWIEDNSDTECNCNPDPDAINLDDDGLDCSGECNGSNNENENGCCLDSERDCQGNCPNCSVTADGYSCVGEGYLTDTTYQIGDCSDGSAGCDCAGVCAGDGALDDCGVCNGGNATCTGCMDINACNTGARADGSGQCTGNTCTQTNGNSSDCDYTSCCNGNGTTEGTGNCDCDGNYCPDGAPNSAGVCQSTIDECTVCGGGNLSCTDCAGVVNGNNRYDFCNQCLIDPTLSNVCNDGIFNTECLSGDPDCPIPGGGFYECITHPNWNDGPGCCNGHGTATGNTGSSADTMNTTYDGNPICDCDGSGTASGTWCPDGENGCTQQYDECNDCGGSSYWNSGNYQGDMGCNHICDSNALTDGCGNCQYLEGGENPNPLYYGTNGTDYGINGISCDYNDLTLSGGCPQGCNEGDCPHWAESGVCADCAEDLDGTLVLDDCGICGGTNNQTTCVSGRDSGWIYPTDLNNYGGPNLDCNCQCYNVLNNGELPSNNLDICGVCDNDSTNDGDTCIPTITLGTIDNSTDTVQVNITNSQYVGRILLLIDSSGATIDNIDITQGVISSGWTSSLSAYDGNKKSITLIASTLNDYLTNDGLAKNLLTLNISPSDQNHGEDTPYWVQLVDIDSINGLESKTWYDNANLYEYPTTTVSGYDEIKHGCLDPYSTNCLSVADCNCIPGTPLNCANYHKQSSCTYPSIQIDNFEFPNGTNQSITSSSHCTNISDDDNCVTEISGITSSFTLNPYVTAGSTTKQAFTEFRFGIGYNFTNVYNLLSSNSSDISSYVKYTIKGLTSNNVLSLDNSTGADFNNPTGNVTDKYILPSDTFYEGGYCPGYAEFNDDAANCPVTYVYYPEDEEYLMSIEWPHDWHDTNDPLTGAPFTEPRISSHIKFSIKKSGCRDNFNNGEIQSCNYLEQFTHDCAGNINVNDGKDCCTYSDVTQSQTGGLICCLESEKDGCGFCEASGDVDGVNWGYNLGQVTLYENSDGDNLGCESDSTTICPHLTIPDNYFALKSDTTFCQGQFSYPGSGGFSYSTHCQLDGTETECDCGGGLYSQTTANSPTNCPSCVPICSNNTISSFSGDYSEYSTSSDCASTNALGAQVFGYCVEHNGTGYCHYVDDCGFCFIESDDYVVTLDNGTNYTILPGTSSNPSSDCYGTCYNPDDLDNGFGSYTFDTCDGECVGGNTGYTESDYQDECGQCGGVCNSVPACENSADCNTENYYSCYFVNGCYDCTGEFGGDSTFDACGICGGENVQCIGASDPSGCPAENWENFVVGPDADCAGQCGGQQSGDDFGNCCDMTSAVTLYPDLDQTSTSTGDCTTTFEGCSGEVGFCMDNDGDITLSEGVYSCSSGAEFILTNPVQICLANAPATSDTPVSSSNLVNPPFQPSTFNWQYYPFDGNYYSGDDDWCVGFGPDSCSDCWSSYEYYNLNLDCNGVCDGGGVRDLCGYCYQGTCINGASNGSGCSDDDDCLGTCLDSSTSSCVGGTAEGTICDYGDDTPCLGGGICLPNGYNADCTGCTDPSADNATYDPTAQFHDQSMCEYDSPSVTSVSDGLIVNGSAITYPEMIWFYDGPSQEFYVYRNWPEADTNSYNGVITPIHGCSANYQLECTPGTYTCSGISGGVGCNPASNYCDYGSGANDGSEPCYHENCVSGEDCIESNYYRFIEDFTFPTACDYDFDSVDESPCIPQSSETINYYIRNAEGSIVSAEASSNIVVYSWDFTLDLVDGTGTSQSEFTARSDIWAKVGYENVPTQEYGTNMKIEIPAYFIERTFDLPQWTLGGPEDDTKWYCPTPAGTNLQFLNENSCNTGAVYYCESGSGDHAVLNGTQCFAYEDCNSGGTGTPGTCTGTWQSPGCELDCVNYHDMYIDLSADIALSFNPDNTTAVTTNFHYPSNDAVYVSTTFDLIILQGCMDAPDIGYDGCTCETCAHACGYCDDGTSTSYFECSVLNTGTWTSYCITPFDNPVECPTFYNPLASWDYCEISGGDPTVDGTTTSTVCYGTNDACNGTDTCTASCSYPVYGCMDSGREGASYSNNNGFTGSVLSTNYQCSNHPYYGQLEDSTGLVFDNDECNPGPGNCDDWFQVETGPCCGPSFCQLMPTAAFNYNPNATMDDGTCQYFGCTNPLSMNYSIPENSIYWCNPLNYPNCPDLTGIWIDDGSCVFPFDYSIRWELIEDQMITETGLLPVMNDENTPHPDDESVILRKVKPDLTTGDKSETYLRLTFEGGSGWNCLGDDLGILFQDENMCISYCEELFKQQVYTCTDTGVTYGDDPSCQEECIVYGDEIAFCYGDETADEECNLDNGGEPCGSGDGICDIQLEVIEDYCELLENENFIPECNPPEPYSAYVCDIDNEFSGECGNECLNCCGPDSDGDGLPDGNCISTCGLCQPIGPGSDAVWYSQGEYPENLTLFGSFSFTDAGFLANGDPSGLITIPEGFTLHSGTSEINPGISSDSINIGCSNVTDVCAVRRFDEDSSYVYDYTDLSSFVDSYELSVTDPNNIDVSRIKTLNVDWIRNDYTPKLSMDDYCTATEISLGNCVVNIDINDFNDNNPTIILDMQIEDMEYDYWKTHGVDLDPRIINVEVSEGSGSNSDPSDLPITVSPMGNLIIRNATETGKWTVKYIVDQPPLPNPPEDLSNYYLGLFSSAIIEFQLTVFNSTGPQGDVNFEIIPSFGVSPDTYLFQINGPDTRESLLYSELLTIEYVSEFAACASSNADGVVANPNLGGWKTANALNYLDDSFNPGGTDFRDTVWKYVIYLYKCDDATCDPEAGTATILPGYPLQWSDWGILEDYTGQLPGQDDASILWDTYDETTIPENYWPPTCGSQEEAGNLWTINGFYPEVRDLLRDGHIHKFTQDGSYKVVVEAYDLYWSMTPSAENKGTSPGISEKTFEVEYVVPIVQSLPKRYLPWQGINIPENETLTTDLITDDLLSVMNLDPRPQLGCFLYKDLDESYIPWSVLTQDFYEEPFNNDYVDSGGEFGIGDNSDEATECNALGGDFVEVDGYTMCEFTGNTCPNGWNRYMEWGTTLNRTCFDESALVCEDNQPQECSTGAHSETANGIETCGYYTYSTGGCNLNVCYAQTYSVVCYPSENIDFYPDVDVRTPLSYTEKNYSTLFEYYDPELQKDKYYESVAPAKVEFYFYPRNYADGLPFSEKEMITDEKTLNEFYIGFLDWGDGSDMEYRYEPVQLGYSTILEHSYEKYGIYEVTGKMFRVKIAEDARPEIPCNDGSTDCIEYRPEIKVGDILGIVKHRDFLIRMNLNKNLGYEGEFEQVGGEGFQYLPLKGDDVVLGGISEYSMYYKTIKRQLGYVGDSTTAFKLNFQYYADRIDAEYALAQVNENYKGLEIIKYTGSNAHSISENISDSDVINYYGLGKTFPSKLHKGFYSGSIDDDGILTNPNDVYLIYKGKYNEVGIFGNHIGDCDIAQTSIISGESGSHDIASLLGFQGPEASDPSHPRYWKNIIPANQKLEEREGVEIVDDGEGNVVMNVDTSSKQSWQGSHNFLGSNNNYYYPVLPKVNEYGVFSETLGLQEGTSEYYPVQEHRPFGESERSWKTNAESVVAGFTIGGKEEGTTTLNLDFSNSDDQALRDSGGNGNMGVLTGDYKMDFERVSKKPTRADMKHISENNSDKKAF